MLQSQTLMILIGIFLWFTSSIMVNIQWKSTLNNYDLTASTKNQTATNKMHTFALYFTVVQFATGALTSFFLIVWKGKHKISLFSSKLWKKGFAIGIFFFAGQLFTNGSLTMTSITLTHTIKSLEPLLALLWTLTILKNQISCLAVLYIHILVVGVILVGFNDLSFHMLGFLLAMGSNVALSLRNLSIKLYNKNEKNSDGLLLFFVSCFFGFIISSALYFLINQNTYSDYQNISNVETIKIGFFFSGQHIMSYILLDYLTIASHALTNCLKRTLIIFISAIFLGNYLPPIQILGILITLIGTSCYIQETYISLNNSSDTTKTAAATIKTTWRWDLFLLYFIAGLSCYSLLGGGHNNSERGLFSNKGQRNITGVWGFDAPLNENSLKLVNDILNTDPNLRLNIYCSNVGKCLESVAESPSMSSLIYIHQLRAFELTVDSPVAGWMASHPINKIKSRQCFPIYFHKMVYIGILWKFGDIVIDMALNSDLTDTKEHIVPSAFTGCLLDHDRSSTILCSLPPRHNITHILFQQAFDNFNKNPEICMFTDVFHNSEMNATNTGIRYRTPSNEVMFGLLGYENSDNIGDEVQSIAAAHILPYINKYINRYNFINKDKHAITYIGNGWWDARKGILFKNISNLNTIPVAVHIDRGKLQSKDLLNAMAPIGTRDLATYELLKDNGIETVFTGCLTLWMKNPDLFQNINKTNEIIIVDLKWSCTAFTDCKNNPLPKTLKNIKHLTHTGFNHLSQEERYNKAYGYLMQYAQAKVVLTSRIHIALPCVALGTPVIFINSKLLDGADSKNISPRLTGLLDLFHTVDTYTMNEQAVLEYFQNFNWNNPPPNPNPEKVNFLKNEARKILEHSPELAVSINVFELL